jgi:hypothetical protein
MYCITYAVLPGTDTHSRPPLPKTTAIFEVQTTATLLLGPETESLRQTNQKSYQVLQGRKSQGLVMNVENLLHEGKLI